MEIPVERLTLDEINNKAEEFLDAYHPTRSLPIPIEDIIDLKLQIDIIPIPGLKQTIKGQELEIDGFISWNFASISVDEYVQRNFSNRYRFTLAHEIAHRQLHGYYYAQFRISRIEDWKRIVNEVPSWPIRVLEYQANMFAGLVLAPRKVIYNEFLEAKEEAEKIVSAHGFDGSLILDITVGFLAEKFQISEGSMRICLERDGIIS